MCNDVDALLVSHPRRGTVFGGERRGGDENDLFWLEAELRLMLAALTARTVRRWRDELTWTVRHAAARLEQWRKVLALHAASTVLSRRFYEVTKYMALTRR